MIRHETKPDLIVLARRCHTLDPTQRAFQALAIRDGRICAGGSRRSLRAMKGRYTKLIDAGSAVITPGLVDCHTHFFYWALQRAYSIDVSAMKSLSATLERIRTQSRKKRFGEWVVATGFDHNAWPEGLPSAHDLDRVVPDRPVLVRSRDAHTSWLNTAALRRVGITARTPDPKGGRIVRDSRGRPTGILKEAASDLAPDPIRELAVRTDAAAIRTVDAALAQAYQIARSLGIVGVHSMDDAPSLSHFQRHHAERKLGLRVVHAIPLDNMRNAIEIGLRSGLGDDWLRIGAVKVFSDGALGSQTAYMFRPYPGSDDRCGLAMFAPDELRDIAVEAARNGLALWIHAIGDRAVSETIRAIAAARRVERSRLPHRIEHAQCVRPADIRRMAKQGVIASVQPCHILGDIRTAERHWPRASRNAYAFRSMLDAGVTLAMGSDVPIESIDPRRSLHGAVLRTEGGGYPEGGWYAGQRLTAEEVLRGFTVGAAIAAGKPTAAGALTIGAPADLTIWRDDPLAARPEELLGLRIAGCVIGGTPYLNGSV